MKVIRQPEKTGGKRKGGKSMNHQEQLERFAVWLAESRQAVFFGGAGVSTESGIPDFRSTDGLYNQTYDEPPEEI